MILTWNEYWKILDADPSWTAPHLNPRARPKPATGSRTRGKSLSQQQLNSGVATTAMIIVELMIDGSAGELANRYYTTTTDDSGGICSRRDHIYVVAHRIELWCAANGDFHDKVDGCWDWEILPIVIEHACRPVENDGVVFSSALAIESLQKMYADFSVTYKGESK